MVLDGANQRKNTTSAHTRPVKRGDAVSIPWTRYGANSAAIPYTVKPKNPNALHMLGCDMGWREEQNMCRKNEYLAKYKVRSIARSIGWAFPFQKPYRFYKIHDRHGNTLHFNVDGKTRCFHKIKSRDNKPRCGHPEVKCKHKQERT